MVNNVSSVPQLGQYESSANGVFKLISRPAGTYSQTLSIRGNTILSSVYVKSIDPGASLKVNYYDYTTDENTERNPLNSHDAITATSIEADKILVHRFTDKPVLEAVVTGGNIEFSVYVTVITDPLVQIDGTTPITVIPSDSGTTGTPYFNDETNVASDPGVDKIIVLDSVTAGKTRWLHSIAASCRVEGVFTVKIGSDTILTLRNSVAKPTESHRFVPARPIAENISYSVFFCAVAGLPSSNVDVHVMLADVTN